MSDLSSSETKICCMDLETPRNTQLTAFYKRSFAYYTVKERMPVIITQTIDMLVREKDAIAKENPPGAREELKNVISELSKFKYEIQTNKPLRHITSKAGDVNFYNKYLDEQMLKYGHTNYFNSIWLHVECYMYRRIREAFELTKTLNDYDPFRHVKRNAFFAAIPEMRTLGMYVMNVLESKNIDKETEFIKLLKLNLWGNKCDLSLSNGVVEPNSTPKVDLNEISLNILSDHSKAVWLAASDFTQKSDIIDIIFDNLGYEFFTDLCLADFIITQGLAKKVRFYVKAIPWFISDVTTSDVNWFLNHLKILKHDVMKTLAERWSDYLFERIWTVETHDFWTLPVDFSLMASIDPDLYNKLAEAKLAIFKGDLNYRKLFGEKNWDPTTSVSKALQGFHPTKICTLRTMKADIVVGLEKGQAEKMKAKEENWMISGKYGLIQFCDEISTLK